MRFERRWLTAAIAAVLAGCAGSIPDEPALEPDEMWEGEEPTTPLEVEEHVRVSVERAAGQLSFAFEYCLDDGFSVQVHEITVTEAFGTGRERCHAKRRGGGDPPGIWRWTFGDASAFDVRGCEPLEPNRAYRVRVETSSGCFGFEGSKQFEIGDDGSISMSGESCGRRPSARQHEPPTSAP
jgi:hypothetical protein